MEDVDEVYQTSSNSSSSSSNNLEEAEEDEELSNNKINEKKFIENKEPESKNTNENRNEKLIKLDGETNAENMMIELAEKEREVLNISGQRSSECSNQVFVPKLAKSKNTGIFLYFLHLFILIEASRLLMPSGLIWRKPNPSLSSSLFSFDSSRKTSLPSILSHTHETSKGFEERNKKASYLKKLEEKKSLFF